MRRNLLKTVALFTATVMLILMLPISASAEGAVTVYSDAELREALENGGEIIVDGYFGPELDAGSYLVTKDTTIYMNYNMTFLAHYRSDLPDMPVFIVEGATLTLDTLGNGGFDYYGHGSIVELVGTQAANTALVVQSGSYNAYPFDDMTTGVCGKAESLFAVDNTAGGEVDITLYGGYFCNRTEDYQSNAPLFSGDGYTTCVKGGRYSIDPSEMMDEGYAAVNQGDSYNILPVTDAKGSAIDGLLDSDGKFIVKRFEPGENDIDMMGYALDMLYNEGNPEVYLTFYWPSYDIDTHTVYASRTSEPWGEPIETYLLEFKYLYDPEIKTQIDEIVDKIPQGELNEWEEYEPYCFEVSDLALLNYWQTWYSYYNENYEEYVVEDNVNNLMLYSEEFKKLVGYKNFRIEIGMGDGGPFYSMAAGDGEFSYGDTVYAAQFMSVRANSIFYVPEDTDDEDILSAIQSRFDGYLGEGVVTAEDKGSLLEWFLLQEYEGMGYEEPFEEWKADLDLTQYNVAEMAEIEGLDNDDHCYSVTINEIEHTFVVLKGNEGMSDPEYLNIDVSSNVSVATNSPSVPLDTLLEVENYGDAEQEKILSELGAQEGKTYDISLYSNSDASYVTKLENGNFSVKLPFSSEYEGKDLTVYYIDEEGNVTEHPTVVKNGVATFITKHFSAYTLATSNGALAGDINDDSALDICDLVALARINYGLDTETKGCDVNGDATVDLLDMEAYRLLLT